MATLSTIFSLYILSFMSLRNLIEGNTSRTQVIKIKKH